MKKISLIMLILLALVSSGCSPGEADIEVRNFIQSYVSTLQLVYVKGNLNSLAPIATEKEIKKVFPILQALKATDNIMNTEILEFVIKASKVQGDTATVTTRERWRFWWQDVKTGLITKPKSEESYRLEYNLVRANGQWKVDFIKDLKE